MDPLTDSERFLRFRQCDFRYRGGHRSIRLPKSAYLQHEPVDLQQSSVRLPQRSSKIVAQSLGETSSYIERARFVLDHATAQTIFDLEQGEISFCEALTQSRKEKTVVATLNEPESTSLFGIIRTTIRQHFRPISQDPGWNNAQRTAIVALISSFKEANLIAKDEADALRRACMIAGRQD